MAEPRNRNTPEQYDETRDPKNPPNSVLNPQVRRTTTRSFLWPLIVLTIVAGIMWVFWLGQPPRVRSAEETGILTTATGTAGARTQGGGVNTDPDHARTEDELKFRGVTGTSGEKEGPRLQDSRVDD
jgi:hypothetical protein